MKRVLRENILKNAIVFVLLIFTFFYIRNYLSHAVAIFESEYRVEILIVFVSIICAAACTGNFAFTYEKINSLSSVQRMLAHVTTGLLMLVIGVSLEMISILVNLMLGQPFLILDLSLLSLYIASVLYDFWDLLRMKA